ncbi:TetR/AcrR family transcriptional regulator [Dethiothermospora halolimnae]|uniref:TetR/AcrR family transcriptional regulator n=1 Tax=Dethiothermospora halolimnae TaxID=3114390 RepID=UPI003CCBA694
MGNKEIQKQRKMKYFIESAKEIIKEDGIKGVTARKVGQRAGYSYATIYNYFNDLNTLLAYCAFDFLEDCYKYLISFKDETKDAKEQVISYALAYFRYFAENPDIFHLIFIEELGELPEELVNSRPSVAKHLRDSIVKCADEGYVKKEDVDLLGELITSSIHGKLLFFLKRSPVEEGDEIVTSIKNELDAFIKEQ